MTGNNTADSWNAGLEAAKAYKRMYGVGTINLGGGPHGSKVRGDAETEAWEAFQPTLEHRGLNERDMASARQNFMHAYYQEMNKGTYQERNPSTSDMEDLAFDAGKEWGLTGSWSSGVSNANVRRYGFVKWWNNTSPAETKGVRKSAVERAFYEGYKIGREKANQGFRERAKGRRNPGGGRFGSDESDLTGSVIEYEDPMTGDGRIMHSTVVYHGPSTVRTRSGETIRLRDIVRVWDKAAYVRIFGKVPEGPIAGRRNPDGPDGEPSYLDVYNMGVAAGEKYKAAVMSMGLTEPTYGTIQSMYAEADEPGLGAKYAGGADGFDAFRDGFREGYMTKGYVTRTPPDWGRKENPEGRAKVYVEIAQTSGAPPVSAGTMFVSNMALFKSALKGSNARLEHTGGPKEGRGSVWTMTTRGRLNEDAVNELFYLEKIGVVSGSDRESNPYVPYVLKGGYTVRRQYDDGSEDYYPRNAYVTKEEAEKYVQEWKDSPYYDPRVSMSVVKFDDYELEGGKWVERQSNPTPDWPGANSVYRKIQGFLNWYAQQQGYGNRYGARGRQIGPGYSITQEHRDMVEELGRGNEEELKHRLQWIRTFYPNYPLDSERNPEPSDAPYHYYVEWSSSTGRGNDTFSTHESSKYKARREYEERYGVSVDKIVETGPGHFWGERSNPDSSAKAQRMAQDILARVKRAGGVHSSVLKNIGGGYDLFVYKLNSLHRDWKTHQFGVDLTASGQKIESRVYRDESELLQGLTHAIMTKKLSGVDHLGRESNPDSESSWDESVYDRAIGWEHIGYGMARLYSMRDYEVLANIKPGPNAYPGFQVNILGTFEERLTPSASEAVEWAERKVFGRMLPQLAESRKQVENKLAAYHKGTHPHSRSNPEPSDGTPDIYRTPVTIGGKRVTIFSSGVSSRQKANIINRLFPDHSGDKQWHTRKAQEFVDLKNRAVDNHSSLWESSFRETFGRAPEPYDFRISGIGSDKLPADVKDRLRDLSRVAGAASEIAGAHAAAAGVKYHHGGHYLAHSSLGSKRNPTYEVYNYKTGEPAGRTFDTLQEAQEWIALRRAESPSIRLFWKVRKVGSAHNPEPDAADLYESFHGKPSEELLEIGEEVHYHENLAGLGTLTEIKVDCFSGYSAELKFDRDTQLCSNEEGTQLYIVGGDQSLDLKALKFKDDEIAKDQVAIGVITEITYNTQKGFHNFKPTDYYHELGEESGYQPILTYDTRSQLLTIAGGAYKIKPEGIVN